MAIEATLPGINRIAVSLSSVPPILADLQNYVGGSGTNDHSLLTNRDASDQHPISAVTGLQDALAGKQNTIEDLTGIRSGAALGATALQSVPGTYRTASEQDVIDGSKQSKAIADTGGFFTSDTVEDALQELGAELSGINTLLGSGVTE